MPARSANLLRCSAALLLAAMLAGCSTLPSSPRTESPMPPAEPTVPAAEHGCFDGRTGARLDWEAAIARLAAAEIVLVGEQHDNIAGHRLEAALTDALLQRQPRAAVALEMFERHEQGFVDLHLDGRVDAATLMTLTESENWGGGRNTWMDWYQPIVDHVQARRAAGAALVAANAPRAYVKLARLAGFETLAQLPANERVLFALPDAAVDDSTYRGRFFATMRAHSAPGSPPTGAKVVPRKASPATASAPSMPQADPAPFFRAQQLWDATMAESVVRAHRQHPLVVLFVGDFHIARAGGTFLRIRHTLPEARIATVSIQRSATPETFVPGDAARSDLVIYTPERGNPAPR